MKKKIITNILLDAVYLLTIFAMTFSVNSVGYAASAAQDDVCEPREITIWHAYVEDGSEEAALLKVVSEYERGHECVDVIPVFVPFESIYAEYEAAVTAGGGPDMFTAPNDLLGSQVRAGLIQPLNSMLKENDLKKYSSVAVDGVTIDGQVYAVPGLVKAVALYYNKDTVPVPPATTDELLQLVTDGKQLVISPGVYFSYGFWGAFGGNLLDENGRCIADQGGFVEAFDYIRQLRDAGAMFEWDLEWSMGSEGGVDMAVNGPWILGDMKQSVGEQLGVALLPSGPAGPARPLIGVDGWYINPNSTKQQDALDLALYIFGKNGLKEYVDIAGDPVAYEKMNISDPLSATFVEAAGQGYVRPQTPEFDDYWWAFDWAWNAILYDDVASADAVSVACHWMNEEFPPRFSAFPEWEYIEAWEWPEGSTVFVSVDNKPECAAEAVSGRPDWDPNELFAGLWLPETCDVAEGDRVTVGDGVTSRSHTVRNLAITAVDASTNQIAGEADPGTVVNVWAHGYDELLVTTDADGHWLALFNMDISEGMGGRTEVRDPVGNATAVEWMLPKLTLRVNYGDDWVESFFEAGHTINLQVTDADGQLKASATMTTAPLPQLGGEPGFQTRPEDWYPAPPDIQPGDWVHGQVENGLTADVQIGEITGVIDLDGDVITGTVSAPWFSEELQIDCHSWGAPLPEEILKYDSVLPDGQDTYSCSWFGEWDIQPGQIVGVGYSGTDGNWVANTIDPE